MVGAGISTCKCTASAFTDLLIILWYNLMTKNKYHLHLSVYFILLSFFIGLASSLLSCSGWHPWLPLSWNWPLCQSAEIQPTLPRGYLPDRLLQGPCHFKNRLFGYTWVYAVWREFLWTSCSLSTMSKLFSDFFNYSVYILVLVSHSRIIHWL